jgi:hypothetical protein
MIFSYKKFFVLALFLIFMFVGSIKISQAQNNQNKVTLEPSSVPTTTTCPPNKPNCYQLFGGFASLLGKGFESIDASQGLGGLMNGIIATLIKLGGVGAIIMFMVYGVQLWNANDNGEKRKSLKSKMIGTIGGFLLMLTTFIILRTINPDLLNLTPRIDFTKLDADEAGDSGEANITNQQAPTDVTKITSVVCKEGFVVVYGTPICKTLANNFKKMIDAAKNDGLTISATGFRTRDEQIALRKQNCGTGDYNIYEKPSDQCNPHTARPGFSRHESGLALDFMCNGLGFINPNKRPGTLTCFSWMSRNANQYGFKNYQAKVR